VLSHSPTWFPLWLGVWFEALDHTVLWLLGPLAFTFLLSGLDDLGVDFAWLYARMRAWVRSGDRYREVRPKRVPPRSIAILVPLWKEHEVIQRMLAHNIASIRYPDYHFFVGVYPNDAVTQAAVRATAARHPNVHLALCPHDGPTSKADCLNWIYQHVSLFEEESGEYFEVIVTHDAEDVIHPEELRWINDCADQYDFIQIPVLALPTPLAALTHGVYCDEFAEYHTRDMSVRSEFGCFIPGSGVGTGFRRDALEKLARASSNRVFEPAALTEDYENGLQLHRLGCRQAFVPLVRLSGTGSFLATREYFPQSWYGALRQRTRWVTGIALQGWERFGWKGSWSEIYWLWRDRKGLIGSPLGVIANAVFIYGLATGIWTRASRFDMHLAFATLSLQFIRVAFRTACVTRVYGLLFALGVPVRVFWANFLNAAAAFCALWQFASAKIRRRPLRWLKTEHAYPSRATLLAHRRRVGEILVGSGQLALSALQQALDSCPPGMRLGAHLIRLGYLDEDSLYGALSLQQGLPVANLAPSDVSRRAARALPAHVAAHFQVLPFRIAEGSLFVATPEIPPHDATTALRSFTSLEIRYHLVTPTNFARLTSVIE
jgi:adsorption protein B